MEFDPNNNVIKLCAQGMEMEGKGQSEYAEMLFFKAWSEATNDFEKFTAAHYVARHQKTIADKLSWDSTALELALKIKDETIKGTYPSLYLNIAKGYEDLSDFDNARKNYQLALSFMSHLPEDGYGNMIRRGISNGIERLS
jgi:rifampin ADP-ribosylating transferase